MTNAGNLTGNFANGAQTVLVVGDLLSSALTIASRRADGAPVRTIPSYGYHAFSGRRRCAGFHRRRFRCVRRCGRVPGLRLASSLRSIMRSVASREQLSEQRITHDHPCDCWNDEPSCRASGRHGLRHGRDGEMEFREARQLSGRRRTQRARASRPRRLRRQGRCYRSHRG